MNVWNVPALCWNNSEGKPAMEFRVFFFWQTTDLIPDLTPVSQEENLTDLTPSATQENTTTVVFDGSVITMVIGSVGGTVGVTQFFRNAQVFRRVKKK